LLDAFEMIEPELKMAVLAQDLTLFRNLKTLSRSLTLSGESLQPDAFDWNSLTIDPAECFKD